MKNIIILILAGFILLAGSQAMAWPGGGHSSMGPGNGYACNRADLDLTPEQSNQLIKLRTAFIKAVTPFQNQMITLRSELQMLWDAAQPEKEKIFAKEKEMSDLRGKISEIRTTYQLDCRAILTPDQLARTRLAKKVWEQVTAQLGTTTGPGKKL
jgi:Spy/CpxP family protein refolding chaperone